MNPIFSKTRYNYKSYSDFWKLVELSGFRTCYTDQINLEADEIYISAPCNGEHKEHLPHRRSILKSPQKATVILWQLEKPYNPDTPGQTQFKVKSTLDECLKFFDTVWISDRWISSMDSRFVYAELGSHPEFASGPKLPVQYDVAHLSCQTPRRDGIYSGVRNALRLAPNAWGQERDTILRSTRAMLNVHQDETFVVEPLRIAVAAAYKLAYLTEASPDLHPLEPGKTCHAAPYDHLANDVTLWFAQQDLAGMGNALYDRLCVKSDFRRGVMDALERTFSV